MAVRKAADVAFEAVAAGTGTSRQVLIGPDEGPNFAMRRFRLETGGSMPLHTNTVEHEQYVLAGRARIRIGDEEYDVGRDDVVLILKNGGPGQNREVRNAQQAAAIEARIEAQIVKAETKGLPDLVARLQKNLERNRQHIEDRLKRMLSNASPEHRANIEKALVKGQSSQSLSSNKGKGRENSGQNKIKIKIQNSQNSSQGKDKEPNGKGNNNK